MICMRCKLKTDGMKVCINSWLNSLSHKYTHIVDCIRLIGGGGGQSDPIKRSDFCKQSKGLAI